MLSLSNFTIQPKLDTLISPLGAEANFNFVYDKQVNDSSRFYINNPANVARYKSNINMTKHLDNEYSNANLFKIAADSGRNLVLFESTEAFESSPFFKSLLKKKNPKLAIDTVIKITNGDENRKQIFIFDESEKIDDQSSWWDRFKDRKIKLIEINVGEYNRILAKAVPLSNCGSSTLSTSGASITLKKGWSKSLTLLGGLSYEHQGFILDGGPPITFAVIVSVGFDMFSVTFASGSSVKCSANPGEKVQVLGDLAFASFPNAKHRLAEFSASFTKPRYGKWNNIVSRLKYKALGMIMFNKAELMTGYCSTSPQRINCGHDVDEFESEDLQRHNDEQASIMNVAANLI